MSFLLDSTCRTLLVLSFALSLIADSFPSLVVASAFDVCCSYRERHGASFLLEGSLLSVFDSEHITESSWLLVSTHICHASSSRPVSIMAAPKVFPPKFAILSAQRGRRRRMIGR